MANKQPNIEGLARFGTVYSKPGQLGRAHRQETSVNAILKHLERARLKSFLVVGPSGAGKSAILHQAFRELVRPGEKPWMIVKTSTAEVMSGTKYLGEWQTRLSQLINLARANQRILIYFTDIHNLRGAGRSENDESNLAEAIAPSIESGKVIVRRFNPAVICPACTIDEQFLMLVPDPLTVVTPLKLQVVLDIRHFYSLPIRFIRATSCFMR